MARALDGLIPASSKYSTRIVDVEPYFSRISMYGASEGKPTGWWFDDRRVGNLLKEGVVAGLSVHNDKFVVTFEMIPFDRYEREPKKPHHGEIVQAPYGANHSDGDGLHPCAKEGA